MGQATPPPSLATSSTAIVTASPSNATRRSGSSPASGGAPVAEKKAWSDPELLLDQWNKYEMIAMHFNDLLMRFRTQGLAGLTAVSGLATVFANAKGITTSFLPVFFGVLCLFWTGAWVLDTGYYSKLLKGAVDELLDLEKRTKTSDGVYAIQMSSGIARATGARWRKWIHWFYGLVLLGLLGVTTLTTGFYFTHRTDSDTTSSLPLTGTITVNANVLQALQSQGNGASTILSPLTSPGPWRIE